MAENRKGKGNSLYYLTRRQLFTLAGGFTLTSVLVFLLGILIGQGIEERKVLRKEEPLVKVPLRPLTSGAPSAQGGPGKDEMTFYDTLAKAPAGAGPSQKQQVKEAKNGEKAAKPVAKEAKEAKEVKVAKAAGPDETPAKEQKVKETAAQKTKEKAAPEKIATAAVKKPAPTKKPAEEDKTKAETAPGDGAWTIQVNAFPDEKAAQRLVERLKEKGYDSYVVVANIKGQTWYRVRVGRFATKEEAKELQEDLQKNENFTKANIVSR